MSLSAILKWVDFAKAILPVTLATAGVPTDKIGPVIGLVTEAEGALGPGKGTEKLQHVVAGVQDAMQAAGASSGTIQTVTSSVVSGVNTGIQIANTVHTLHSAALSPAPGV